MSFSKNLIASATCSVRPANDARRRATRRRARSCRSGPAARIIGLALGATRSSTRKAGPCPSAAAAGVEAVLHSGSTPRRHGWWARVRGPMAHPGGRAARSSRGALRPERMRAAALWEVQKASHEAGLDCLRGAWNTAARIGTNNGSFAASERITWSVLIAH